MQKTDILVIGSGPAGMTSAITAKRFYPEKKVLVLKDIDQGCVPCGIPYMLSSLKDPAENRSGSDAALEKHQIENLTAEVVKIDREKKEVITASGDTYGYEKLIMAIGSNPIIPPITGVDKEGVYPIKKDMVYLLPLIERLKKSKAVLVIGGGFIGVEFADEIAKLKGIKVYLVELLPKILSNSFDEGFSKMAKEKLQSENVELITGVKVEEILGDKKVNTVKLSNGRSIEVDGVVLGIGATPNTKLASDAELKLDDKGGILVDKMMNTSDPDIFAIGDCAGKIDFFSRKTTSVMLASTASAEARVAGANLYELRTLREDQGTIAIYSTCISGLVLGAAGMTEQYAIKNGYEVITGNAKAFDKHPAAMPGADHVKVRLVFLKDSGVLVGGQIAGGAASSELINIIGVAIQSKMTATEIATMQYATHPYLTSSPTGYPIVLAAQEVAGSRGL